MVLHTFWGNKAICIEYIGMAEVVDFIKVTLPTIDKNFDCQPLIGFWILSIKYW